MLRQFDRIFEHEPEDVCVWSILINLRPFLFTIPAETNSNDFGVFGIN